MQTIFDWLALSSSGQELMSTLYSLRVLEPGDFAADPGPPLSALSPLCRRCRCFSSLDGKGGHCRTCADVLDKRKKFVSIVKEAVLIWGCVNVLPAPVLARCHSKVGAVSSYVPGLHQPFCFIPDEYHFLAVLKRHHLQAWLQELVFAHGRSLQGHLQIFPSSGSKRFRQMGDILSSVKGLEDSRFLNPLHIRFYPDATYVFQRLWTIESKTFLSDIGKFLSLLELVKSFKHLFDPYMQRQLLEILSLRDPKEKKFFWGRLLGQVEGRAREFLDSYGFDQWPLSKIRIFSSLMAYVSFEPRN